MTSDLFSAVPVSPPLSFPSRLLRGLRAAAHVFRGIFVPKQLRKNDLPSSPDPLADWCRDLLSLLGVDLTLHGEQKTAVTGPFLLVSNHISWMDICLIRALFPVRFIAKEEIALWPVVGPSARNAGTLFIGRHRLSSFREILSGVRDSMEEHISVAVFPEGTTTTGDTLLPFRTGIFDVCAKTGRPVLPVSIRYENSRRTSLATVSYTGGESFARSFWRTLGESRITARVHIGSPVFPEGANRKELARESWERVREGLLTPPVPVSGKESH